MSTSCGGRHLVSQLWRLYLPYRLLCQTTKQQDNITNSYSSSSSSSSSSSTSSVWNLTVISYRPTIALPLFRIDPISDLQLHYLRPAGGHNETVEPNTVDNTSTTCRPHQLVADTTIGVPVTSSQIIDVIDHREVLSTAAFDVQAGRVGTTWIIARLSSCHVTKPEMMATRTLTVVYRVNVVRRKTRVDRIFEAVVLAISAFTSFSLGCSTDIDDVRRLMTSRSRDVLAPVAGQIVTMPFVCLIRRRLHCCRLALYGSSALLALFTQSFVPSLPKMYYHLLVGVMPE